MVFFLTSPVGAGHVEGFVRRFDRTWGRTLVESTYANFVRRGRAPRGAAYIFTDRTRMSPGFRSVATALWDQLDAAGGTRPFSHPGRQLGRFELLRALFERGLNDFNIYRLNELELAEPRFPVFIRLEDDHSGPKSGLIETQDALDTELAKLIFAGADPDQMLVVEFVETDLDQGNYWKYGAIRIGDRIIGQHILQSPDWNTKAETRIRNEGAVETSDDYFLKNPHADRLMPLFELSGIEFGRIDYGLREGKIQTWEINDNPIIAGSGRSREGNRMSNLTKGPTYFEAFEALTEGIEPGEPIAIDSSRLLTGSRT